MLTLIDDRIRFLGALMAHEHVGRPSESMEENQAVIATAAKMNQGASS